MPQFTYKSVSAEGHQSKGVLNAPDRETAVSEIRKSGARPLLIRELDTRKRHLSIGNKVKIKELVIFTRELATMVDAGVSLPRTLNTLSDQSENKYFREVIASINHDVESGVPLADSMAKFPNVFSEVYVNMVRAGEAGGLLDTIMKRLATQVEKDSTIRHKIRGAMAYPVVILTVTIIAFFGIMLFIMPKIDKILHDLGGPNAKFPIYTQIMLNISNFLTSHSVFGSIPIVNSIPLVKSLPNIFFFAGLAVVAAVYLRRYVKTPKGQYKFHALMLRVPILNMILIKIVVARFSRTFASLMSSGVTVLETLEITGKAIGNRVIQKELAGIAENVKNGQSLGKLLLQSEYFPPIVGQMMSVGEETGKIDQVLVKVADFYEEEVDTIVDSLASIIEPMMIIILGALVGLIAASVMGPIAGLSKNIGN